MPDRTSNITIRTKTDTAAVKTAVQAFDQLDKTQQAAARSALTTAQNLARLDAAMGQPTAGAKRLQTALQTMTALPPGQAAATLKQIDQLELQAIKDAERLVQAQKGLRDGGLGPALPRTLDSFGTAAIDQVKSSLMGVVGPAAVATAAVKGFQAAIDLGVASSKIDATRKSFDSLAVSAHTTGDALLTSLRAAAQGTVSDADLIQSANSGILLTGGTLAKELPRLLEIARASAQASGDDIGFVFDSLVKGIARGSPQIIDNAKITLDAAGAFETYAKSIGKTPDQLSRTEQQQATLNAVMAAGTDIIAKTGGAAETNATQIARLQTNVENAKNSFGSFIAGGLGQMASQANQTFEATEQLIDGLDQLGSTVVALADGTYAFNTAQATASGGSWELAGAVVATSTAINDGTTATNTATAALQAHAAEYLAVTSVTEQSVQVSLADAAAKQEVALKTQLLTAETNAAVSAFMALNPNIDAGGVAALVMAGKIDPLLAQLIQARLRANEATNAMIAFNNQANIKSAGATIAANRAAGRMGRGDSSDATEMRAASDANATAIKTARSQQIIATGTTAAKKAELQKQYDAAVKTYGAESVEAINAQTKLIQAQEKGGAGRAGSAAKTANRLETLEGNTSEKIQSIVRDRDKKLADLDEKYAEQQLENKRKLANSIANTAGNRRVSNEVDDLDLFGKHTPDEARKLNDRERAEADARKRSEANAEEARKKAEEGDAESAETILQIREKANQEQEDLDKAYYEKQAELGKNPELQAALQKQYEEAQKAIQEQSDREVAQANVLADLKKQQREKEHDEIIASAQDAANVAIGHAQRMSDSIIKATGTAGDQGSNNLKKIGDAVNSIPKDVTVTVHINQQGSTSVGGGGSSGGGTKAAGGGTFMSNGPTTLTVGDNPGGREIVTVTPVGGRGTTTVGAGMVKMAGGGVLDAGGGYTTPVAVGSNEGTKKVNASKQADAIKSQIEQQRDVIALLSDLIKLRGDLEAAANQQPFNIGLIQGLSQRGALFLQIVQSNLVPTTKKQSEAFSLYVSAAKDAISILGDVAGLRHDLSDAMNDQPFNVGLIEGLANRAALFLGIVQAQLVPISEAQGDQLSRFADGVSTSVAILKDVADLRKAMSEAILPAPDLDAVRALARDANQVTAIVQGTVLPLTQAQAQAFTLYHDAASASIDIVKATSELGKTLQDNASAPISLPLVQRLASDAQRVTAIVQATLTPTTEDQANALQTWSDAVGAGVSVIKDVSDLSKTLQEDAALPLDLRRVTQLANDARRVTAIVTGTLTPTTEAQATAMQNWADAEGAAVGTIKDVSDLSKTIRENASTPLAVADVQRLASDARRVTGIVQSQLVPSTEAQSTALQDWESTVGAGVGVIKDVSGLTRDLFTDYQSPSNAQIALVAKDAKRIADGLVKAASTYSTDGLAAGKSYAEAVGTTFGAFKDGLLFFEALKSGDYGLDAKALASFEKSTLQTLAVAKRLGAVAATIPAGDIAALGITTQALAAQSEALIKLAAVPFGDIQPAAAGLAQQSAALLGGASRGGDTIINFQPGSVVGTPGMNMNQLADLVIQKLNARTGMHK
jgi:hypothetical protein